MSTFPNSPRVLKAGLVLIDPDNETVLHTQPIAQIRVWGVGRDNGR